MGLKGSIFSLEICYFYLRGMKRSSEAAMDGVRAAPLLPVNKPKKTGARSALARTRGQNPLVSKIWSDLLHVLRGNKTWIKTTRIARNPFSLFAHRNLVTQPVYSIIKARTRFWSSQRLLCKVSHQEYYKPRRK